jgi:hypothetical protein
MMGVAKDSTCGRPGKIVCCRGTAKSGKTKKGVIAKSADTCVRKKKGEACLTVPSETLGIAPNSIVDCDAAGRCPTTTTTTSTTPSTTTTTTTTMVQCPREAPGLPGELDFTVATSGSDLDEGWTGTSHNFPVIQGSTLRYCLSDCNGTTDTLCDGSGETGENTLNGPTFGAPLPLLAAGIPVCVINRYQSSPLRSTFDLATGQGSGDVNLFSDVYLTSNSSEVCPRCNPTVPNADPTQQIGKPGKCSATARAGAGTDCTIEGQVNVALGAGQMQYFLSSACLPAASQNQATLDIRLPLTTGQPPPLVGPRPCGDSAGPQTNDDSCVTGTCTEGACTGPACVSGSGTQCIDAKGGISQACCSNNTTIPCFTTKGGGSIIRTGSPILASGQGAFAATFCIARTGSTLINASTGLPGPGALILPSQRTVSCGAGPCP